MTLASSQQVRQNEEDVLCRPVLSLPYVCFSTGRSDHLDHVTCAFCGMELASWPAMESQQQVDRIHFEMSERCVSCMAKRNQFRSVGPVCYVSACISPLPSRRKCPYLMDDSLRKNTALEVCPEEWLRKLSLRYLTSSLTVTIGARHGDSLSPISICNQSSLAAGIQLLVFSSASIAHTSNL